MAFPTVVGRSNGNTGAGGATSFTVPIPAGSNGELLVITWAKRGGTVGEFTIPTGWTSLGAVAHTGGFVSWQGLYRVADGTEGATVTLTNTAARRQTAICQRISGHDDATAPDLTTSEGLYSASEPDPPNHVPGTTDDFLWIGAMVGRGANVISAGPSGYSNLETGYSNGGGALGAEVGVATAEFTANAASEDPGTFTTGKTVAQQWLGITIAVYPELVVPASPSTGGAGVGQTGYWRTGVWVEPLTAEGDFALVATGILDQWLGRFSYSGEFDLSGTAVILFDGVNVFRGQFEQVGEGDLDLWEGTFTSAPDSGIFGMVGKADIFFAWVPELGTGGEVGIEDGPSSVEIKFGPGDAFIFEGASGTVVKDSQGRLVVIDQSGEVMCIIGPSGVILR